MGKPSRRFVAKAEEGRGWRIWDRTAKKWWGEHYRHYPEALLAELNGEKRPDQLTQLALKTPRHGA